MAAARLQPFLQRRAAVDENSDYNAAALRRWKNSMTRRFPPFSPFKTVPKSTYQPNANYWLGQLFYNKGKKDDAAYHFAVVKN
ncbi:hypothetical protein M8494_37775 [Serratia ureilytica]